MLLEIGCMRDTKEGHEGYQADLTHYFQGLSTFDVPMVMNHSVYLCAYRTGGITRCGRSLKIE